MGATPSHQANTQALNHELWEAEGVLRVPPHMEKERALTSTEGMLEVEGGAVCKSSIQEECCEGSLASTALASTLATHGLWSRTTSLKEWYPDEHPFIKNTCDSDDPDKTPYTLNTQGFLLYKWSFMPARPWCNTPIGFKRNKGVSYINYPIQQPHESMVQQAHYMQAIMAPSPIVVGLQDDSNKVFRKPLYTYPIYKYDGKPTYTTAELDYLKVDMQG